MSRKITSKIESQFDRRMLKHFQDVVAYYVRQGELLPDEALIEYIRAARRRRWSFDLIGEALSISSSTARRRYRKWQDSLEQ